MMWGLPEGFVRVVDDAGNIAIAGPNGAIYTDVATAQRAAVASNNGGKLLWASWKDYPKVTVEGREYAQIGDRLYTRHAVDRMQPSGLGTPVGSDGPGRNVTPNMVEEVIAGGSRLSTTVNGVLRTTYTSGNVTVVTEDNSRTIVTILRNSSR